MGAAVFQVDSIEGSTVQRKFGDTPTIGCRPSWALWSHPLRWVTEALRDVDLALIHMVGLVSFLLRAVLMNRLFSVSCASLIYGTSPRSFPPQDAHVN